MNSFDIEILRRTRTNILNLVEGCSYNELTIIPKGFSNSILWNFSHVAIVQQLLIYGLTGKEMLIDSNTIDLFRKGQSGKETISEEAFNVLKSQFLSFIDTLEQDYIDLNSRTYKEYPTSYGVVLHSVDEAIAFNNTHEALHFGIMMAMVKKLYETSNG